MITRVVVAIWWSFWWSWYYQWWWWWLSGRGWFLVSCCINCKSLSPYLFPTSSRKYWTPPLSGNYSRPMPTSLFFPTRISMHSSTSTGEALFLEIIPLSEVFLHVWLGMYVQVHTEKTFRDDFHMFGYKFNFRGRNYPPDFWSLALFIGIETFCENCLRPQWYEIERCLNQRPDQTATTTILRSTEHDQNGCRTKLLW